MYIYISCIVFYMCTCMYTWPWKSSLLAEWSFIWHWHWHWLSWDRKPKCRSKDKTTGLCEHLCTLSYWRWEYVMLKCCSKFWSWLQNVWNFPHLWYIHRNALGCIRKILIQKHSIKSNCYWSIKDNVFLFWYVGYAHTTQQIIPACVYITMPQK